MGVADTLELRLVEQILKSAFLSFIGQLITLGFSPNSSNPDMGLEAKFVLICFSFFIQILKITMKMTCYFYFGFVTGPNQTKSGRTVGETHLLHKCILSLLKQL